MKVVNTFEAKIYVGLRPGYSEQDEPADWDQAMNLIQQVVDQGGLGVTVTPLVFQYKGGREPGMVIGIINYPRFPEDVSTLKEKVLNLGYFLLKSLKQERLTVVFPHQTYMLEKDDAEVAT